MKKTIIATALVSALMSYSHIANATPDTASMERLLKSLEQKMNQRLDLENLNRLDGAQKEKLTNELNEQNILSGKITPVFYADIDGDVYALISVNKDHVAKVKKGDEIGKLKITDISPRILRYEIAGVSH
ncbi:MAG: hypothetical protein WCS28_11265, partial [Thiomicrospira sp.]